MAEKVNDVWQFVIYDAFGKLVAEYGGNPQQDEGSVKYYLQDWQGSIRAGVNSAGYVKSRTDHQAFGEPIASGIGLRTETQGFGAPAIRQGYGLTEKDSTGLNHTWFRKNENRAGRWTSPDPYNGSSSVGDPQSWNRYSYVENQPTNYVDPSGLLRIQQCTRYWWFGADGSYHQVITTCQTIHDDGGGVAGGQNQPNSVGDEPTGDCARFLQKLDELAAAATNVVGFLDSLAKTFIGVASSGYLDMSGANNSAGERFNSTGWKSNLYDNVLDNQARHFVGGLIAGFRLADYAGSVMGHGERSEADLRVNAISIPLGARIDNFDRDPIYSGKTGMETTPGKFDFRKLAGILRDKLCS